MKANLQIDSVTSSSKKLAVNNDASIDAAIAESWSKIAPCWPLKNLIAVNPLAGFEDMPFLEALKQANMYFQQAELPEKMQAVNRQSIKWLQAFFDQGQSTIHMPLRHQGLLQSTLSLLRFDSKVHDNDADKLQWLKSLSVKPNEVIAQALQFLEIPEKAHSTFLTLMLTTLAGWSSYIQYRCHWADEDDRQHAPPVTQYDYLALRLILTCLMWPEAKQLLAWHQRAQLQTDVTDTYQDIQKLENEYQRTLLKQLSHAKPEVRQATPKAQFVFCIDVRSAPFRQALEAQGDYETFGFAGFFGIPVAIKNSFTDDVYAACPALLKPQHCVGVKKDALYQASLAGYQQLKISKTIYQSLKYTFTTPFTLVEMMGLASGVWMTLKIAMPRFAMRLKQRLRGLFINDHQLADDIESIPFPQQVNYAKNVLSMLGLTDNFAPVVIFCGHASATENNAYASALDCGACGGHAGGPNARMLAKILNSKAIRLALKADGFDIPDDCIFLGAEHNTTTDVVTLFDADAACEFQSMLDTIKRDLAIASGNNAARRYPQLPGKLSLANAHAHLERRSRDWSQTRPEWGLAGNAAMIIAPSWFTKHTHLEGRVFLHSYRWDKDINNTSLEAILTAPMVVAQWINAQYLFSTLDNVAFGGGSKITQNITGKIGVMQGNASDLMHGLPLQSVFANDAEAYHQTVRLSVVILAPKENISAVIAKHDIVKKLISNGWIHLLCHDPNLSTIFKLERELSWTKLT